MEWIIAGVAILICVPAFILAFLGGLFLWLKKHYVPYILRIYQEVPIFIVPRGEIDPLAQDVEISTRDGLRLRGAYFKTPVKRRGVILFGIEFGSDRWSCRNYCEHLIAAGFDVFAYEPRNQGESQSEPALEPLHWTCDRDVTDAQAALAYVRSRPDADPRGVGWFGISKGAGAGLAVASLDPTIRCAVTDGMFSSRLTVLGYMRRFILIYNTSFYIQGLLPDWYYARLAETGIRRVGHQRGVEFIDLGGAVRQFRRPLLMIHGRNDKYIRPEMAQPLFNMARPPKEFWLIPGANHNQGLSVAGDEYRQRVLEFFERNLA